MRSSCLALLLCGLFWSCQRAPLPGQASDAQQQAREQGEAEERLKKQRLRMVETQLRARDIRDEAVLGALAKVARHRFVPARLAEQAYNDNPLPIGHGQTISQPYIVAYMTQAAEIAQGEKVLEIGTGSGYQAAVLGELAREVYSIEIIPELAESARKVLNELGYKNVQVKTGNGYLGWPEHAPFDAIIVTAAPEEIPKPLLEQLALNGKLVIPVGDWYQEMTIVTKTKDGVVERRTIPVRFVPMTGKPKQ